MSAPEKWTPCDLRCDCCLELEATIAANQALRARIRRHQLSDRTLGALSLATLIYLLIQWLV